MEYVKMLVSALICLTPIAGIFVIWAVITTNAKLKSAEQIRENIMNGVYNNWPNDKTRWFKILVGSQVALLVLLICVTVLLITIYFNQSSSATSLTPNLAIAVFSAVLVIATIMVVISIYIEKMIKQK